MTLHDTVTVHSYSWTGSSSRRDHGHPNVNPAQDARLAAMLVQSCQGPARTTSRATPWELQDPLVLPTPGNKLYETSPPREIRPGTLSRPSSRDDAGRHSDLPFRHWEPTASALAPSLNTTSSPPALAQTPRTANDQRQPPAEPLQSILRPRPTEAAKVAPTALVSSSSTSAAKRTGQAREGAIGSEKGQQVEGSRASPLKRKKTVRVESPRTSEARHVEAARVSAPRGSSAPALSVTAQGSSSSSGQVAAAHTSSTSRSRRKASVTGAGSSEGDGASLAIGAIQRCIPPPYAHPVLDPLLYPDQIWQAVPDRTQCTVIRHSFVDSEPLNLREDQVKPTDAMRPYLQCPRRGAWLVPLSGSLPVDHTSPATWSRSTTDRQSTQMALALRPIEWTDERLSALWAFLTKLHEQRSFGYVRAQAVLASEGRQPLRQRVRATGDATVTKIVTAPSPDVVKINCAAHLALPIRALLAQINVPAARKLSAAGPARKAGGASPVDTEKFLMGRALVWIDEEGRPVMTA